MSTRRKVSLITLGCARNEVDSEELAARIEDAGWDLADGADGADGADVVVVNTCGFIEAAKKDSIDTLLAAHDSGAKVVAAGCMAERYGRELAEALPEADAVLGFDDYTAIGERLDDVMAGRAHAAHTPRDRRTLLPISPVQRSSAGVAIPGHGGPADLPDGMAPASGPRVLRRRLGGGPVAPLKLASGCDRRCTFCAIPAFRGAYVSRPPEEVLEEARWLAGHGARELVLVSENSTSYGKDLGDLRALEKLLPGLAAVDGIERVRVSYLQPAETRPGLIEAICGTPGVAPYFDMSFQHASGPVLRSMRRFGDRERFLGLLDQIRALAPEAGVRSNFIVGFPGETEDDFEELAEFLTAARLDAVGVFGYSDEEGTEAANLDGRLDPAEVAARVEELSALAEELTAQRAEDRVGSPVRVLLEDKWEDGAEDGAFEGRAEHQAPEVDGTVLVRGAGLALGEIVAARVTGSDGVDLIADVS
ncbi:30S ribosomal protein S12 methylthiotransferase RimO [Actinomadura madurae]|uniref:30S ribosomal protein S12 methylthiotransferase RimO n=1 Tax=Actinomadura madurae TaxID=1993 RepID=UPI0020263C08|nr:30S ribosomal protein S12 methylthiotransferase RimO [Actinomadura madurae]URN00036.1 30S ribosomal protein S12 methylthiotransferase RimO [Actinomadura madurae]URN02202.1 30S ribosomal protein S12 methylthiotransferase RimO [Actinomadura madurae]